MLESKESSSMRFSQMIQCIYILSASTGYRTVIHCYISLSFRNLIIQPAIKNAFRPRSASATIKWFHRFPFYRWRMHPVPTLPSFPRLLSLPAVPHCPFAGSILHTYVYTYLTSNSKRDRLSCCCLGFFFPGTIDKKSTP